MATWTVVTDPETSAEAIIIESLMRRLRDNPESIREGDATAPKNQIASLAAEITPWIEISQAVLSNDATIDFTGIDGTYDLYKIVLQNIKPIGDPVSLLMRVGTGVTPTWQTSSVYAYHIQQLDTAAAAYSAINANPATSITIADLMGNTANEHYCGIIDLYNPADSSYFQLFNIHGVQNNATPDIKGRSGVAGYKATTPVTAIRFFMSSGNLSSGTITLYGLRT